MERLTERYDITPDGESNVWVKNHDYIKASEKLAEYEDLEEQGLLLELPCKVGDLVFIISGENICGRKVKSIKILSTAIEISTSDFVFHKESFDETVFLTRAEATKKLYEMEGQNGIKQNE